MTLIEELAGWAGGLTLDDVPERVVEIAKIQVLSQLAAARGGMRHPLGQAVITAYGPPLQPDPSRSACVLAGLTSWLSFDDTAYAGHLSNSTVNVPVAYARARELDGRALLTAVVAANECAARITAAATLGPFRGQSAAHTHLAGSVCGRLRCEDAPAPVWVRALGLAFGMPPWTLTRGFLGSDAKVLSSFVPVRIGLDACDGAAAGLAGAADLLEHPDGFLARFATVPLPEAVTAGFGARWHTETLSFKVRPGGPGIDAAVDCALALRHELDPEQISEVEVTASLYTVMADLHAAGLLDGERSPVSALILSVPYTVATALLTGALTPEDFAQPALADRRRWDLAKKVHVIHDPEMTRRSLLCTTPFGEALRQAGPRAAPWLEEMGVADLAQEIRQPGTTFENAAKITGARVEVRLADGRRHAREVAVPRGAAGSQTRADHAELVREKFLACGGPPEVADAVRRLDALPAEAVGALIEKALAS